MSYGLAIRLFQGRFRILLNTLSLTLWEAINCFTRFAYSPVSLNFSVKAVATRNYRNVRRRKNKPLEPSIDIYMYIEVSRSLRSIHSFIVYLLNERDRMLTRLEYVPTTGKIFSAVGSFQLGTTVSTYQDVKQ